MSSIEKIKGGEDGPGMRPKPTVVPADEGAQLRNYIMKERASYLDAMAWVIQGHRMICGTCSIVIAVASPHALIVVLGIAVLVLVCSWLAGMGSARMRLEHFDKLLVGLGGDQWADGLIKIRWDIDQAKGAGYVAVFTKIEPLLWLLLSSAIVVGRTVP